MSPDRHGYALQLQAYKCTQGGNYSFDSNEQKAKTQPPISFTSALCLAQEIPVWLPKVGDWVKKKRKEPEAARGQVAAG